MPLSSAPITWPNDSTDVIVLQSLPRDWVDYKLRAADWYIATLREIRVEHGANRTFAVEMALDGAFGSLNGAFDGAVAGCIKVAEERYSNLEPTEEHLRLVPAFQKTTLPFLVQHGVRDAERLELALTIALQKDPPGWLTTFRRTRNKMTHQTSTARLFELTAVDAVGATESSTTAHAVSKISVGSDFEEPVEYLEGMRDRLSGLTDRIVAMCETFAR